MKAKVRVLQSEPARHETRINQKHLIEESVGSPVELGHDRALAAPTCDGGRFVGEFGFKLQGLRERLSGREVNKD